MRRKHKKREEELRKEKELRDEKLRQEQQKLRKEQQKVEREKTRLDTALEEFEKLQIEKDHVSAAVQLLRTKISKPDLFRRKYDLMKKLRRMLESNVFKKGGFPEDKNLRELSIYLLRYMDKTNVEKYLDKPKFGSHYLYHFMAHKWNPKERREILNAMRECIQNMDLEYDQDP